MRTVEDRDVHSVHAYFLRAGTNAEPVSYEVERIRDGRSISSRRVVAKQHGKVIFYLSSSFHIDEDGYAHQESTPTGIPSPEELLKKKEATTDIPETANKDNVSSPFLILPIPENFFVSTNIHEPEAYFWIKTSEPLAKEKHQQTAALAFASDLGLLATALLPHPSSLFERSLFAASIDHAMWFHSNTIDLNDWILCHTQSPWAGKARGYARASLFTRQGELIASTAQEGLIRPT